jgi:hypothetical protein
VKRPGLDPETAERMLHGERIGPPALAELLAAVAFDPAAEALAGEEAAVAAFHHARSLPAQPVRTRRSTSTSLRATIIGLLLLLLAGGVTMVAASHRLPGSPGGRHSPARNPATSGTLQRAPSSVPERPEASRSPGAQPGHRTPTPHSTHSTKSPGPATSGLPIPPTAPKLPTPTKPAKGKVPKAPGVKIPSPKAAVTGPGGPTL